MSTYPAPTDQTPILTVAVGWVIIAGVTAVLYRIVRKVLR